MLFNPSIAEADRCGEMLAKSRTRSGLSRKVMSQAMDVSESTVKAWESGQGSPTLPGIFTWFRTVGENPFRPMLDFFWPEVFAGLSPKDSDERIRQASEFYFSRVAGPTEIQKLHYLIFGHHGSEWSGLLDMASAHTQTSLNSRYRVAEIIQVSYDLCAANRLTRLPPGIEADRPLLLNAIAAARDTSLSAGKNGYTIWQPYEDGFCSAMRARARIDSGATQKEVAKALGKTEHTIHNWESGHNPSFLDLCAWFHVLNMSAWRYIHCTLYPMEKLTFLEDDEKRRSELVSYLSGISNTELRKLLYLVAGNHGSNWFAILEMIFEHACSPLSQRVISARSVLIGYQMEQQSQQLQYVDHVLPDLENLERCIRLGTNAAKDGKAAYKT